MQELKHKAASIRLVIFDVDGVLTDGRLYFGDDGQEYKAFNSKDGHGMVMLQQSGVKIGIITGRTSEVVRLRMENLGIAYIYQGRPDKLPAYEDLRATLHLSDEQIAYVGDDVVDLPVMRRVGLAIAVRDAHELTRTHADWVTSSDGGRGAAREVCEFLMDAHGTLQSALQAYLE